MFLYTFLCLVLHYIALCCIMLYASMLDVTKLHYIVLYCAELRYRFPGQSHGGYRFEAGARENMKPPASEVEEPPQPRLCFQDGEHP